VLLDFGATQQFSVGPPSAFGRSPAPSSTAIAAIRRQREAIGYIAPDADEDAIDAR
jgi:hypothetical protein